MIATWSVRQLAWSTLKDRNYCVGWHFELEWDTSAKAQQSLNETTFKWTISGFEPNFTLKNISPLVKPWKTILVPREISQQPLPWNLQTFMSPDGLNVCMTSWKYYLLVQDLCVYSNYWKNGRHWRHFHKIDQPVPNYHCAIPLTFQKLQINSVRNQIKTAHTKTMASWAQSENVVRESQQGIPCGRNKREKKPNPTEPQKSLSILSEQPWISLSKEMSACSRGIVLFYLLCLKTIFVLDLFLSDIIHKAFIKNVQAALRVQENIEHVFTAKKKKNCK